MRKMQGQYIGKNKPTFWSYNTGPPFLLWLRQALFVVSVMTAKPVFVVSVLTAKSVFVVSVGLRVFQKNLNFTNFFSIWKIKLYSVRYMKYFSLEIFRQNCDFVGPLNLIISCIKVKFWVFEFLGLLHIKSHNLKIVSQIELIPS